MSQTIIMIHGMWGSCRNWDNYADFFRKKGYHVVTPTLRYHGRGLNKIADPALGNTSLLDYAADLETEIKALNLSQKPIIMGHSMGGLLAQILASKGLAQKLVLLTPAPPAGILAFRPSSTRTFLSVLRQWSFWNKPTRLTFKEAQYGMMALLPASEQVQSYDNMCFESGRATFETAFWFLDKHHASRVNSDQVTCPVLVIAGRLDRITPESVVRHIAKKYHAHYKVFDDHAHWVLAERGWQDVAEYAENWLAKP